MPSGEEEAVRSRGRQQSGTADAHPAAPIPSPGGRDTRWSNATRARIVSLICIAGMILIYAGMGGPSAKIGSGWLLACLLAFQAATWTAAIRLQPSDSRFIQQFDEAVFVASVLLLPPS